MTTAKWNGAVLAASDRCVTVEGNRYFPFEDVDRRRLRPSQSHSECGWKGTASYYDVVVGDAVNRDAAWTYAEPKPAAADIKDHIAFWRGVVVED